jgi:hypothetical protein
LDLNSFDNIPEIEAHALSLHYELLDFLPQEALPVSTRRLWQLRDDGSDAGLYLEIPLLNQVLDHFMRGIRMNLQLCGKRSHRRKRLTRPEFSADERLDSGKHHLVEDGLFGMQNEPEKRHIDSVTPEGR